MSYQDVKDRLYHGRRKIANNTYLELVERDGGEELINMRLHGHTVAVFYQGHLELFSAGWDIKTTKDRLNKAILIGVWSLPGCTPEIHQSHLQWYYGNYYRGLPKFYRFYDGMKIGYDGRVIQ